MSLKWWALQESKDICRRAMASRWGRKPLLGCCRHEGADARHQTWCRHQSWLDTGIQPPAGVGGGWDSTRVPVLLRNCTQHIARPILWRLSLCRDQIIMGDIFSWYFYGMVLQDSIHGIAYAITWYCMALCGTPFNCVLGKPSRTNCAVFFKHCLNGPWPHPPTPPLPRFKHVCCKFFWPTFKKVRKRLSRQNSTK